MHLVIRKEGRTPHRDERAFSAPRERWTPHIPTKKQTRTGGIHTKKRTKSHVKYSPASYSSPDPDCPSKASPADHVGLRTIRPFVRRSFAKADAQISSRRADGPRKDSVDVGVERSPRGTKRQSDEYQYATMRLVLGMGLASNVSVRSGRMEGGTASIGRC